MTRLLAILIAILVVNCSRTDAQDVPSFKLEEPLSYPSSIKFGGEANQAWWDLDEWIQEIEVVKPAVVRLEVFAGLSIREVAISTQRVWDMKCQELLLRVSENGKEARDHRLHCPAESGPVEVLVVLEGIGVSGLRVGLLVPYGGVDYGIEEEWLEESRVLSDNDIQRHATAATVESPMHLLISRDLAVSRLDDVLSALTELGAESFICLTY